MMSAAAKTRARAPARDSKGHFLPKAAATAGETVPPCPLAQDTDRDLLEHLVLLLEAIAYQTSRQSRPMAQYLERLYARAGH